MVEFPSSQWLITILPTPPTLWWKTRTFCVLFGKRDYSSPVGGVSHCLLPTSVALYYQYYHSSVIVFPNGSIIGWDLIIIIEFTPCQFIEHGFDRLLCAFFPLLFPLIPNFLPPYNHTISIMILLPPPTDKTDH